MSAGGDELSGAGEAHREQDEYDYYSAEFRRPQGHVDPTAVTALVNVHFGRSGLPRSDWRLRFPRRVGQVGGDLVELEIAPDLMAAVFRFIDEVGDVSKTRSGKAWRARLKRGDR